MRQSKHSTAMPIRFYGARIMKSRFKTPERKIKRRGIDSPFLRKGHRRAEVSIRLACGKDSADEPKGKFRKAGIKGFVHPVKGEREKTKRKKLHIRATESSHTHHIVEAASTKNKYKGNYSLLLLIRFINSSRVFA